MHFHEYAEHKDHNYVPPAPDTAPWKPWRSRIDFEVAALALESSMSENQTNKLIDIVKRVSRGLDKFTLKNHKETQMLWDLAPEKTVKVCANIVVELPLN